MNDHGPDAVARDYLFLVLRLDRHIPGTVDGYYGPPEHRAAVDAQAIRRPQDLVADALHLRQRIAAEIPEADRRHWMDLQLAALETLCRTAAGESMPYLEQVARCFAYTPTRRPEARFDEAAATLEEHLPGDGTLTDRLARADDDWTVPADQVRAVVDRLIARFRTRAASLFGLPEREDLDVSLVRDQPWSGYNWYDGGFRSRVELNVDLPIRLSALVDTIAHETYPGHHLEHALKEQGLVNGRGWIEASILSINTPECLISEGLASLGPSLIEPEAGRPALLEELGAAAGVPLAADPGALREAAARQPAIEAARGILGESRVNAALLRHADGRSSDEVRDFLVRVGRYTPERAAKSMEFIEHPLWRLYVFVYPEGEALLRRWVEAVAEADRPARFGRLLREPLTPVSIQAELVPVA